MEELRTYVCKRLRMCDYLIERGFYPYSIKPDRENPKYDVFLFTATPDLYKAVKEYINHQREKRYMRIKVNNSQLSMILSGLRALQEEAVSENQCTNDQEIIESNDNLIDEVDSLCEYLNCYSETA